MIHQAQATLTLLLGLIALAMEVFALVDAVRTREDAFRAAGKLTKQRWTIILAVATVVGFIFFRAVFSLPGLAAVVAAGVYLADVRPALRQVLGRGGGDGPYGRW